MRILAAVQAIFALAFTLFGLVTLFGIGITGLLFLIPGIVFAVTAGVVAEESRAAAAMALAVDAVLAWFAMRTLAAIFAAAAANSKLHESVIAAKNPGLLDYLPPAAALVLVGVGALAVMLDWRTLKNASWF
jgi:p-aminobenzoyl-glutamate transporter AbgT